MQARARIRGNPIHQLLIVIPLGLLATSIAFDIAYLATKNGHWADIAFWMISAGIVGGLIAAIFGFIDWLAIPRRTRAMHIGLIHGIGNVIVVALFMFSWWLRKPDLYHTGPAPLVISFLGIGIALFTGWLGGELVNRLGVGVDEGTHLNAPSSLLHRPVSDHVFAAEDLADSATLPGCAPARSQTSRPAWKSGQRTTHIPSATNRVAHDMGG